MRQRPKRGKRGKPFWGKNSIEERVARRFCSLRTIGEKHGSEDGPQEAGGMGGDVLRITREGKT
jgi:hypothetical protein